MEKLAEILNQELEVFNKFLGLLDQQHKQIISRKLEELKQTNSELDFLTLQVTQLENKRMLEVSRMSEELGLSDDDIKLRDLLPDLDTKTSFRLKMLRESIVGAHRRAEEKSLRNKKLIERSRKLIADSIAIVSSKPSPIYQKPGPGQPSMREGSMVNRSV